MGDDDDTLPGTPKSVLGRTRTRTTQRIPEQTLAQVADEWRDTQICDLMLHEWVGHIGAPVTDVHRKLAREALGWGRALPLNTTFTAARVAAITGGPSEALLHLLQEYIRHGQA